MTVCYYCCRPARELRPYGPDGAAVCFACMSSTPAREAEAVAVFARRLDSVARVTGVAQLTPAGPVPCILPRPAKIV